MDEQQLLANIDEANALIQLLRDRTVTLNLEVRKRDKIIEGLHVELKKRDEEE